MNGLKREIKFGSLYKHFKGNVYKVLHLATDTETGQVMVVYTQINKDNINGVYSVWVRPLDMFLSEVDHDKYPDVKQKYRFEEISREQII